MKKTRPGQDYLGKVPDSHKEAPRTLPDSCEVKQREAPTYQSVDGPRQSSNRIVMPLPQPLWIGQLPGGHLPPAGGQASEPWHSARAPRYGTNRGRSPRSLVANAESNSLSSLCGPVSGSTPEPRRSRSARRFGAPAQTSTSESAQVANINYETENGSSGHEPRGKKTAGTTATIGASRRT